MGNNPTPPTGSKGRPPGSPNKTTVLAREAIARFVDGNTTRMQGWLDMIADDPEHGPLTAFNCVRDILEFHVPKLARSEVKHEGSITTPVDVSEFLAVLTEDQIEALKKRRKPADDPG